MKGLSKLLGSRSERKATFAFLAIAAISLVIAFIIGISDNPPGIALFYIAVSALILAFVYRWREVKKFLILLIASVIGFPIFAVLHNLFYALAELSSNISVLYQLLGFFHALFFIIALIVCPPGILIGVIGSTVIYFKRKRSRES